MNFSQICSFLIQFLLYLSDQIPHRYYAQKEKHKNCVMECNGFVIRHEVRPYEFPSDTQEFPQKLIILCEGKCKTVFTLHNSVDPIPFFSCLGAVI